jgi:glycosyltransferase involved in cell wall biosynthesis
MKRLLIIPAYNEEANIGDVVGRAKSYFPDLDILVVDDGSCDQTARIAGRGGALVITHPFNMGYGVALQTGYKYAYRNKYDFVVQMDGDGQHDARYIKELFREIESESTDVVIGSRFISGGKYEAPPNRRIGMFLFSRLVSLIVGQRITDSTSGFQALNNRVVKLLISDIYPCDYPDADVIIMLHRVGFRIKEVPLVMHRRPGSKSMHSGFKPAYYIFKMTLSIFVTLLRSIPKTERKGD